MTFKRLNTGDFKDKARRFLHPMGSYTRWLRYLQLRIQRLPGTPHAIAFGFACGAFASFTPLVGFHFIIAGLMAWMLRGSILASAFGTAIGNPWTFPFIWISTYRLGYLILGREVPENGSSPEAISSVIGQADNTSFMASFADLIVPMLVGSLPIGLAGGLACYLILRPIITTYQTRRHERLMRRRRRRAKKEKANEL